MKKDLNIGFLIHRIDNKVKADIDAQLKIHDLTFSQSQVLFQLMKNGGSMSQKQLQDVMKVSHPTMVGLVQRLEANGYVRTALDQNDKRNKIVTITEAAEQFSHDMEASRKKNRKKMLKDLSEEEVQELSRLLNKVYENVNV